MLIYFYHQLRLLLDAGLISVVRAPLFQLTFRQTLLEDAPTESRFAYTEEEFKQLQRELTRGCHELEDPADARLGRNANRHTM